MAPDMSEKILIFGNGQIGNLYLKYFQKQGWEAQIAQTDITDFSSVEKQIIAFSPTVVINTAAKTNLEWCANNKLEAFQVNVLGADNIAKVCDQQGIYFIHFSSGCIFESKDEFDAKSEESEPAPAAYYSWTKVWSEQIVKFGRSQDFKYLILRPRQPISSEVNYKNMLVKLLTFTKFVDSPNTGTVLEDLLDWTQKLISRRVTGTLNVANSGFSSPYKIAQLLRTHILPELPIELISKQELDKLTPNRRVDTILDVSKLEGIVGSVNSYEQALENTIKRLAANFKTLSKESIKQQLELTIAQSKTRTVTNNVWEKLIERAQA